MDPGSTGVPMGPDGPQTSPNANFEPRGGGAGLLSKTYGAITQALPNFLGYSNTFGDQSGARAATSLGDAAHNTASAVANFLPGIAHDLSTGAHGGMPGRDYGLLGQNANEVYAQDASDAGNAQQKAALGIASVMPAGGLLAAVERPGVASFAANSKEAAPLAALGQDHLGYYSQLDRTLAGLNPSDTVTTDTLAKRGVKASELDARGLTGLLSEGSAKVSDLQAAAKPVEMKETTHGLPQRDLLEQEAQKVWGKPYDKLDAEQQDNISSYLRATSGSNGPAKWSTHSLDPSNPTYRESVLHLPGIETKARQYYMDGRDPSLPSWDHLNDIQKLDYMGKDENFLSGHFSEPNIVAHARTSMQTAPDGGKAFLINELQSDWGQKLRDSGGARDEGKVAELAQKIDALGGIANADKVQRDLQKNWSTMSADDRDAILKRTGEVTRLQAELQTAQASASGHPLVNTTDQWTNTALRRMITQAVDSGADHIALPSGDTVSSFGMGGKKEGIDYAYNQMYPKNLRNILAKIDPEAAKATQADTLDGKGNGFTLFPMTDKVRQSVKTNGQPLFSNAAPAALGGLLSQGNGN